jgi:DNA-binding sugar fermentation-stimulating protein
MVFKNRGERRGGGVAIYIREELKYKERSDLVNIEPSMEHIWIEIKGKNKNSTVLLGVFYQPDFS